jgi:UDP-2,4-diacetamido-2,4,6-trideoxy-beta-L-altropyranose hydrolase
MTLRVIIHADSSPGIGSGHVVRSLALASALTEAGVDVQLASERLLPDSRDRARTLGVATVDRARAVRSADWIVFDGYHLDRAARDALADAGVPRLVVDDLGSLLDDAAMSVNGNVYAVPGRWPGPGEGEALLGPAYALLGREYASGVPYRRQPDSADRILVTMGGTDPQDATRLALDALARLDPPPDARVVLGASHPAADERAAQGRALGLRVIRAPRGLFAELARCDLVVSACGTTVLEAVCLGRPIVGVVVADNQERTATAIHDEQLGLVAGRYPGLDAAALAGAISALRTNAALREAISRRGPTLVDGHGADRVARAMLGGPLRLRPADIGDAERLLEWRNDPVARRASFETEPIPLDQHVAWLRARLADPAHRIWIGEAGGTPIGVVRFGIEDRHATISVAVAPARRGGGIGTRLIAAGVQRLAREDVVKRLAWIDAWIRPGNDASLESFRRAGFREAPGEVPDRHLFRSAIGRLG